MSLTRRQLLLSTGVGALALGAGGGAVEAGVLPGRVPLDRLLGLGRVDGPVPAGPAAPVHYGSLAARLDGRPVGWGLAVPDGVPERDLPVVVALHGRGGDARDAFDTLRIDAFLADHVRRGGAPLAVASVDGRAAYWHPRASGADPLAAITHDLLPMLRRRGLASERIGVLGWSMGGYGALLMAREGERGRLGGTTVVAACASGPALFGTAAAAAPGAFDGAADWHRWGDLARDPGVRSTPLSVSCGTSDPFAEQTRRYREHCPTTPAGGLLAGRHEDGFWRSRLPSQLEFLDTRLRADRARRGAAGPRQPLPG